MQLVYIQFQYSTLLTYYDIIRGYPQEYESESDFDTYAENRIRPSKPPTHSSQNCQNESSSSQVLEVVSLSITWDISSLIPVIDPQYGVVITVCFKLSFTCLGSS